MRAEAPPATALLRLQAISKSFGAVRALQDVDFAVSGGEVVGLVGDNGAGKSTLVKVMAGIVAPDAGRIEFDGRPVSFSGPGEASALGIATVHQDLALCDNLDVVANLHLGREVVRGRLGRVLDEIAMERRTLELLDALSVTTIPDVRAPVAALSGGQRQAVAIARSMLGEPRVVLLDEPTAALGVAQTRQVLELIRSLRGRGLGVVVISHNLADVFSVADRIVVLRLGRKVAEFDADRTSEAEVVAAITGVAREETA